MTVNVIVPLEPPPSIFTDDYDEELFQMCRDDDYPALYRALVKRGAAYTSKSTSFSGSDVTPQST